jgi:uncharacterized membrane protein
LFCQESVINLHPPITALPIGTLFVILVLELGVSLLGRSSSPVLRTFGAKLSGVELSIFLLGLYSFSLLITFFSGYHGLSFADRCVVIDEKEIVAHQVWGRLLLFVSVPFVLTGVLRFYARHGRKVLAVSHLILLLLVGFVLVKTAHGGGALVFDHGAAVRCIL